MAIDNSSHLAPSEIQGAEARRKIHDMAKIEKRLKLLRKIAQTESLLYSKNSANHAKEFLKTLLDCRKTLFEPSVFLIANGNIRLLWDQGKEQAGLQFLEGGKIQFVMFAHKSETPTEVETKVGEKVTPTEAMEAISAMNLTRLITPSPGTFTHA